MKSVFYPCQTFIKLEFYKKNFYKYSHVKFHKNLSIGGRFFPCGRVDRRRDGQTNMTKLIVTFRNFTEVPKMQLNLYARKIVGKRSFM